MLVRWNERAMPRCAMPCGGVPAEIQRNAEVRRAYLGGIAPP